MTVTMPNQLNGLLQRLWPTLHHRHRHRFIFPTLFLLGYLTTCIGAAPFGGSACEIRGGFQLTSVTPMWEERVRVTGCSSQELSPQRSQEVHVVHVREVDGVPAPQVITVHVLPATERSVHAGPLVLALHSDHDVSWRILAQRIANHTKHHVIVTKGSRVIETRDMHVTIVRRNAARARHLLSWVAKRYRALTSYAKADGANSVFLKVGQAGGGVTFAGKGETLPEKCELSKGDNPKSKVQNVEAFIQEPIPVSQRQGCVSNSKGAATTAHGRTVHVIKIHETMREPEEEDLEEGQWTAPTKLTVHVATRSRAMVKRDLALVLHTPLPVHWVLLVEGIQGRVDIVTEGVVEMPRTIPSQQKVSVRSEVLPNVTKDLMAYTVDWFGPAYTFTEVYRANALRVFLDEGIGGGDEEVKETEDGLENHRPVPTSGGHRPRAATAATGGTRGSRTRFHSQRGGGHDVVKTHPPINANDVIRIPRETLLNLMSVECLPQHMRISFPRLPLEQLGLSQEAISLAERHCSVTVNQTHFVLSSPFHHCGTTRHVDHEKIVYTNAVHFHFNLQKMVTSGNNEDDRSIPMDDEDRVEVGSGGGAGGLEMPFSQPESQDDHESEPKALHFQCEYILPGSSNQHDLYAGSDEGVGFLGGGGGLVEPPPAVAGGGTTLKASKELFSMQLFLDPSFVRYVNDDQFPLVVYEDDVVYVETRFDAGEPLNVVTDQCWLSTTPATGDAGDAKPVAQLLEDTCPSLASNAHVEATSDIAKNRFNFRLTSDYVAHSTLYLNCRLAVCTSEEHQSQRLQLKMCVDPKHYCTIESLRSSLGLLRGTHPTVLSRGPFQVVKRNAASRNPFASVPFRQQQNQVNGGGGGARRIGGNVEVLSSGGDNTETIDIRCSLPPGLDPNGGSPSVIILGLSTEAVVGIAFASFVIGVALSAVLWCIYLKTDPLRLAMGVTGGGRSHHHRPTHNNSGYDLSGHSGSSTPSSQSPMTG